MLHMQLVLTSELYESAAVLNFMACCPLYVTTQQTCQMVPRNAGMHAPHWCHLLGLYRPVYAADPKLEFKFWEVAGTTYSNICVHVNVLWIRLLRVAKAINVVNVLNIQSCWEFVCRLIILIVRVAAPIWKPLCMKSGLQLWITLALASTVKRPVGKHPHCNRHLHT